MTLNWPVLLLSLVDEDLEHASLSSRDVDLSSWEDEWGAVIVVIIIVLEGS